MDQGCISFNGTTIYATRGSKGASETGGAGGMGYGGDFYAAGGRGGHCTEQISIGEAEARVLSLEMEDTAATD